MGDWQALLHSFQEFSHSLSIKLPSPNVADTCSIDHTSPLLQPLNTVLDKDHLTKDIPNSELYMDFSDFISQDHFTLVRMRKNKKKQSQPEHTILIRQSAKVRAK